MFQLSICRELLFYLNFQFKVAQCLENVEN